MRNTTINANGAEIRLYGDIMNENAYISLTDIAKKKNFENPTLVIGHWMRNRSTIDFFGLWEQLHNPEFKPTEFGRFKFAAGENAFTLTPQQWITKTGAIGIISKSGRYGGTYASAEELVVLINLEDTSADLIRQGVSQIERLKILRDKAYRQLITLYQNAELLEALKSSLIEVKK